ncbi:MAG: hypothetical protein K8R35_03210 [Bacteroidales bacterium]|nr:hypothetical protein [Bacteroidales bacterium]
MGLIKNNKVNSFLFRPVCLPVFLFLIVLIEGCSVSYSFSGASISPDVKTISVQYFQNRANLVQPGLSQFITDELMDKCRAQTNLEFTNDIADVTFGGEISNYNTKPLTVSGNATAAMNRFTISVKVKFVNSVDPDFSYEQAFTRYEDYDSALELSAVEQELSERIVEQLIEDIFNRAFVNW